MDHVEYVDGFELLIGTEFCQPDDAGTVVGKGREKAPPFGCVLVRQ